MKTVLTVFALLLTVSVLIPTASAQVPTIGVYFDEGLTNTSLQCQGSGVLDTLYVGGKNFGTWISTVEYRVDFAGKALIPLAEFMVDGALSLGQCHSTGITITWPLPQAGFDQFVIEKILVMWQCDTCPGNWDDAIAVQPHQGSGQLQAIEWQSFDTISATADIAVACGLVGTEESTWGKVKALYR